MKEARPNFRRDLEIAPRSGKGGGFKYVVKDPVSKEIYEFGEEEYFLLSAMNGVTPLTHIAESFQKRFQISLAVEQLEAFARRLRALGLLDLEEAMSPAPLPLITPPKVVPIGNPDRLLSLLARALGFCFSRPFLACLFLVTLVSVAVAFKYGGDLLYDLKLLKESRGQIFFLLIPFFGFFVINPLGEIVKGIACKHYRGHVPDFGVLFLFGFLPRFYFDISDSSWLMKKSIRFRVFCSGLLCQLFLWNTAIIVWQNSCQWGRSPLLSPLFTVAALFFFLLNLNPLLNRDGHLLLTNWLDTQDLNERAQALTRAKLLRQPLTEPLTPRQIRGFLWYGLLAMGFKGLFGGFLLGLIGYYLMTALKGVGACLFISLLFVLFRSGLARLFQQDSYPLKLLLNQSGAPITRHRLIQLGVLTAILVILLLPYPYHAGGEFKLLPFSRLGVRAQVAGEIKSVLVQEGQWVKKRQPIAVLVGRDQQKKVEEIKASLDEVGARLNLLKEGAKPEEIAKAEQEVVTAAKALEYSVLMAERYEKMFKNKAIPEQDYEDALKTRDIDQEKLELAKRNLELVKSGARDEEIEELEAEIRLLEVDLAHAEEDLEFTTLLSPEDGQITTPYLSQTIGQFLEEGDLFAVVEDTRTITAEIEVPEKDAGEVWIGAEVTFKTWAYPARSFKGHVSAIAPVAHEKTKGTVERPLSNREWWLERKELPKKEGKVVRVLSELPNPEGLLKTHMTGYAKIRSTTRPVVVAFTRWLVRFFLVEVWSWIP